MPLRFIERSCRFSNHGVGNRQINRRKPAAIWSSMPDPPSCFALPWAGFAAKLTDLRFEQRVDLAPS
jgi:hypothetical protein